MSMEERHNSDRFDRYYRMSGRAKKRRQVRRIAGHCPVPVSSGELYDRAIDVCFDLGHLFVESFARLASAEPYGAGFCDHTHRMQCLYNVVAIHILKSRRRCLTDSDLREWFLYPGSDPETVTAHDFDNDRALGKQYGQFVRELLQLRRTKEQYDSVYLAAIRVFGPKGTGGIPAGTREEKHGKTR